MDNIENGQERMDKTSQREKQWRKKKTFINSNREFKDLERCLKKLCDTWGINGYLGKAKPHTKILIENQLKKMQSRNVIMILLVRWKRPVKLPITLNPKDVTGAQDIVGKTGDNYDRLDISFNSFITWFLKTVMLTLRCNKCRKLCT